MATAKYGVKAREWWKHLKENKRVFWKAVRKKSRQHLKKVARDAPRVGTKNLYQGEKVKITRILGD